VKCNVGSFQYGFVLFFYDGATLPSVLSISMLRSWSTSVCLSGSIQYLGT